MFKNIDQQLRQSFSKSANRYDVLTSLHKEIGRELVKKHLSQTARVIVDIGCGTGYVTSKAKYFYPDSQVMGIDFAEGMIHKAKEIHDGSGIDFIIADAQHLHLASQSVDLIFSNLAYQWMSDLTQAFKEARRVLNNNGVFAITLFGGRSCEELFDSLTQVGIKQLKRLPSLDEVNAALKEAGFKEIHVDYELIKIQFDDMKELLNWLKAIGANQLSVSGFLGKEKLQQASAYYRQHYPYHHGISASFEVIWVKAYGC